MTNPPSFLKHPRYRDLESYTIKTCVRPPSRGWCEAPGVIPLGGWEVERLGGWGVKQRKGNEECKQYERKI